MTTLVKIMITLALVSLSLMARAHRQEEKRFEDAVMVVSDDMIMDTHMPMLISDDDGVFRNYRIPEDDMVYTTVSSTQQPTRAINHGGSVVLISNWPGEGGPYINL